MLFSTWLGSFVLAGDYIEYSPPILNCLKSWWRLLIATGENGAELFPCSYFPQNIYNITAPNNTSILLNHLITFIQVSFLAKYNFAVSKRKRGTR